LTFSFHHHPLDTVMLCPVTGLPVRSRPEWTNQRFGSTYRLTTRVIGDRIVLNQPSGVAELQDIVESLALTDAIIREHIDTSAGYVHISDYAGMRGIAREARKHYVRYMQQRESMSGLIYFNVNTLFRIMIKLARRLSIVKFNVHIVKDYHAAMVMAVHLLGADPAGRHADKSRQPYRASGVTEHHENGHPILRCDHWRLALDDYRMTVEVIDRRIYHAICSGTLKAHHVASVARLRETVRRMLGLDQGFPVMITGTTHTHAMDRKARRLYMASVKQWHQKYPLDLYVFYNANRSVRTSAMLAIPFVPFKVKVVRDLAMALAQTDRIVSTGNAGPGDDARPESAAEDPVHVVHQLLQFIGDIDWEQNGASIPAPVDDPHPFRPVFDAILLIKGELDALLEERRIAEKALRESQQCFDEVLKHSRDILFKRDLQTGAFEYMSDSVGEILGVSPEVARRNGFEGIKAFIHPDDLQRFLAFHQKLQESRDPKHVDHLIQYRMRDSQGKYRWLSETAAVIRDAEGKPAFVIGSNRDVSRIKALEADRQAMTEQLLRSRKLEAVSTMAGGVAHNFNNLLMVVLGNLELMRMDVPPEDDLHRHIDAAEKAAQRAANLSTLMLTYVGQAKISAQTIDLNQTLPEMVAVLKTTVTGNAALTTIPAERPAWIHADSGKVLQVITNLVTNAVEACGERPLELRLHVDVQYFDSAQLSRVAPGEYLPAGSYVSLQVSDNGCGMDTETLDKVFDPFFTTKFTGRGLGMAAVMGIMRAHRGGVSIDSRVDGGTAVTAYFPEHRPEKPSIPAPMPAIVKDRKTILLVDDEPLVLELGKQMLRRLGCDVLTAVDGFEALSVFEANRDQIHLAVLDIEMPRMDGRQTLIRLRETGARFPVLVATGFIETQAREKLKDVDVDGFIQKPFHVSQLQEKIEVLLKSPAM
jgi:PAS domain S-box-containing protein